MKFRLSLIVEENGFGIDVWKVNMKSHEQSEERLSLMIWVLLGMVVAATTTLLWMLK
jgi:hypothetical protein